MECKKFFDENEITLKNVEDVKNVNNNSNNKIIIFISSYEKARENNREFFTKNDFFYLVLDEAHIIKNSMTKTKTMVSVKLTCIRCMLMLVNSKLHMFA
jgi:SNF2 family DNA or RNA helicase